MLDKRRENEILRRELALSRQSASLMTASLRALITRMREIGKVSEENLALAKRLRRYTATLEDRISYLENENATLKRRIVIGDQFDSTMYN
jgi:hypothetical protein